MDVRTQVHNALQVLASDISGHSGFHRLDATFGRELAETSHLNLGEVVVAARLTHRYRRELEVNGMVVPDETTVTKWAMAQPDLVDVAQRQADLVLLTHRSDPPVTLEGEEGTAPKLATVSLAQDRYTKLDRLVVEFPFDRTKVNAMQPLKEMIEGWAFDHYGHKEWSFPIEAAVMVFDEALRNFYDFIYSSQAIEVILHARGKEALSSQVKKVEEHWRELSQLAALEAAQPYLDGSPVANGQRLFRHQREAVQRLIEASRFILAHDMGLGKSRSSLIAAQAYGLPIWVIAPAGTIINWQREAAAAGVEIMLYSWAKLPEPPEDLDYVLITDEAHYSQGGESTIRGKGFLQLAEQARAVFLLTGTPIKNSLPINLYPLLQAVKHPLASDRSAYEKQYCGAYFKSLGRKKTVYDTSGASNLDELHEQLRDVLLYKKKSECVDLPPKIRMQRQAEVSSTGEIAYRNNIKRLRQEHLERMADKFEALRAGRDDLLGEGTAESDLGEFESEFAFALVELGIHRHAASLAKIESAVEIAQEALEQGQGVLLFSAFRDTAERLATKLGADCLTGEVTKARRQGMIDRFQEEGKVLVATIGAGGIGINLTAAQVVVMVDRGWTPTDVDQAEDRAYRLGQRHNVTSIWLQYGPTDDKIDALLELKQERIETILRGRGKNLRGLPGVRALAREIMESVHTGKPLAEILGLDPAEFEQKAIDLVRDEVVQPQLPSGKKDGRLKGQVRRIRKNIMLDEEVVAFLETMKASNQTAAKEGGYSGFLERLVRDSAEYRARKK